MAKQKVSNKETKTLDARKILPPPPFMIFSSKLEVSQSHSDESSDNQKDNEHNKQDAVDGINPVTPDTGKYVVELNVNSTEREKPCHCHLRKGAPVPRQRWNFTRIFCGAARSLELSLAIFPSNTTQHKQWWCYQCPYENYHHNGAKRKCCSCTVGNCNSVKKTECEEQRPTKQATCQQKIPHLNQRTEKYQLSSPGLTLRSTKA